MKYCEDYAALLNAFADGECSQEEAAQVREHLTHCAGCQEYLAAIQAMKDAFPDDRDIEVPAGFADSVMAAVRADAAPRKNHRRRWITVAASLAACLAIVLSIRQIVPQNKSTKDFVASDFASTAPAATGGAEMAEEHGADQEESSLDTQVTTGAPPDTEAGQIPKTAEAPAEAAGTTTSSQTSGAIAPRVGEGALYRRWGSVTMTEDQKQVLFSDYESVADEGFSIYEVTEEEFDDLVNQLENLGLSVSTGQDDTADTDICCLYVYLED